MFWYNVIGNNPSYYFKMYISEITNFLVNCKKKKKSGTSLVTQWLRIYLPMQETQVRALVQEIRHAAKQLSPCAATTEARGPRAHAPQQEKPPQ